MSEIDKQGKWVLYRWDEASFRPAYLVATAENWKTFNKQGRVELARGELELMKQLRDLAKEKE